MGEVRMIVSEAEISRLVQDIVESPVEISLVPVFFLIIASGAVFAYLYKGIYAWGRFNY